MPQAIHISPIDNVVVALHPIAKGTLVEVDGLAVTALEDIPQGHKMAVKPIKNGENVIKYGFPIGHATADAEPGTWMFTFQSHHRGFYTRPFPGLCIQLGYFIYEIYRFQFVPTSGVSTNQ